jgi:uncharacterized membrane protein
MSTEALAPQVEAYLRRLGACLSPLDAEERREIVAEVRAHFAERQTQGRSDVLDGFDTPEAYAARFLEETALAKAVARGTTLDLGRALLGGIRAGAEGLFVVVPLLIAQFTALMLLVLGALKPFFFKNIGLFVMGNLASALAKGDFELGFVATRGRELDALGWWTVPAFVLPGAVGVWACNRALRALAQRRLARARRLRGVA